MSYCSSVTHTVADAILRILVSHGVRYAFGIPGVHNLAFWKSDLPGAPRIISVRHEQSAVYAADGIARATGGLGVALTTTGPGAANTLGAFGEASISRSPLLVISSEAPIASRTPGIYRGYLHEMTDQASLFTPLAKVGETGAPLAKSASNSMEAIEFLKEMIIEITKAPSGAGYLGIPADILSASFDGDLDVPKQPSTKPINVESLAEAFKDSKRIIFWVGGGATEVDREITELSELLKAPIITTFAGRGIGSLSRYSLQVPVHEKEVSELLANADLLIIMGSQFDGMNTKNWTLKLPEKIAAIDAAPELIERNAPVDISLKTDLEPRLFETLLNLLKTSEVSEWNEWADVASINQSARARISSTPEGKSGMRLVEAIDRSWPLEGRVVLDMCIAGYWSGGYLEGKRARRIAYPVGWGTLGFALPTSIGAAIDGTQTLVVAGDGGIAFALAELATLVQESLPITILLHDDGGYGMLRYDQKVMNAAERGVDLVNPDWRLLSESFGIRFKETTLDSLPSDLMEAQKRKGPNFLLLREPLSPPRTTSPRWRESEAN